MRHHLLGRVQRAVLPLFLLSCLASAYGQSGAAQESDSAPFAYAAKLISQMTLEEKAAQMQDQAPAIPRLGIAAYGWWNEGLHGVANAGYATNFPQAIGLAATWDTALIQAVAEAISVEARAKHDEAIRQGSYARFYGLTFWSPNINIFRDPRWGRGQETYGEDPFLTSRIGVSFVEGLQGNNPAHPRVIATPKHFAVHSGPEQLRHRFDVKPSAHDLEDTYLPAFRAAITEAKAGSVMCAYNSVDGQPACASDLLLQKHLRSAWGFTGYVVSDCGAIDDIFGGHKFAPDGPAAAAAAIRAGTDLDCGHIYRQIPEAVKRHLLTEQEVDTALDRLFLARLRLGSLQSKETGPYTSISFHQVNSAAHRELALRSARESIVLLKNEKHLLPFQPGLRIAVVGPAAEYLASMQGNYAGTPLNPVFPLGGMKAVFPEANVTYAQGSSFVDGALLPISGTALKPIASPGKHGMTAEYFNTMDLSGAPALIRTDKVPNFNFTDASPGPGVDPHSFAVRWSAALIPPAPGEYRLGIHLGECYACKDLVAYRMFLDGKLLLDSEHLPAEVTDRDNANVAVHFADVKAHRLKVEYMHRKRGGQVDIVWQAPPEVLLSQAADAAAHSDVVVAFVGLSTNLEGEEMKVTLPGFSGGDRTSIDLPAAQQLLLERMHASGKPLVVVLMNGSALAVNWAQQHAAAIVEAWYPGEQGGTAIAEALAGRNNPAGRLPITFYKSVDQLPAFDDYRMTGRTYRFFHGEPLFPFGFGLSYTTFAYGPVQMSRSTINAGQRLVVRVTVTNTGHRAGDEVAQLYLEPVSNSGPQDKALRGFTRVRLQPKESQIVTFTLKDRDLSFVDAAGVRAVSAGTYRIFIGGGQPGTKATGRWATVKIAEDRVLPL